MPKTTYTPEQLHTTFLKGQAAKRKGFARVAPYYEDQSRSEVWFAGFDGKKFTDVVTSSSQDETSSTSSDASAQVPRNE